VPCPLRPLQDITACESEATKKEVQAGAARKQLDKLQKEAGKAEAERQKLTEQQQEAQQVRSSLLWRHEWGNAGRACQGVAGQYGRAVRQGSTAAAVLAVSL